MCSLLTRAIPYNVRVLSGLFVFCLFTEFLTKREWIYCQGRQLSKVFGLLSQKGPTLKGKNLLPRGANSSLLEKIPFQKVIGVQRFV